jgi:parallel beta-helix repeat protein
LNKALSAMQGSSIHTTYLEGGTYHVGSTINLGSGNNGVTIASAPGQHAVLDGGGSLSTLMQLNGASGVTVQGLTFQNTNANSRAALVLNGASNNHVVGNHFANNGEGMLLNNSSNNNTVTGNQLDNSHSSAIEVQDGSSSNLFDSNLINGTGAIGTAGGGFFLHGVNNNTISHNLVENTAGIGIGVENWDNNTINVGNVITNNIVQNSNTSSQSVDSGAIYELGRSQVDTKSVISNNYISGPATAAGGSGAHIVGIYLDDFADGVQVTNNIVADINMHGMQIHGGSNITTSNNIFDLGSSGHSGILLQSTDGSAMGTPKPMTNDVFKNNIFASSESRPIAFDNISGGNPTIDNNFYMDLINSNFQMSGFSQTNAHTGNAQFANESGGNYNLASTSPALAMGFHQIDQTTMGLHPTSNHWYA